MSDSDDIFAEDRAGVVSGDFDGASKRSPRRQSTRKALQYKDASSSEDHGDDESDDEVVVIDDSDAKKKSGKKGPAASPKKKAAPTKPKSPKMSPKQAAAAAKKEKVVDSANGNEKVAAASGSAKGNTQNDGIDVIIPHSLLNKHQGSGKNECTMLVQVESNDDTSHHLDFHGQSGAIGRFEADDEGVILDLKGYQYRGTIRPGPTAMVVALTRDGQLKVESIVDEFVTLDTNTKTDVMAKLDAVVKGDMDESYQFTEENVNANKKKGNKGGDGKEDDDGGNKNGKKRASTAKSSGSAPKKRKTSVAGNK
ncbi:hypothetical protein ACHAXR_008517 [Thalassiosira sp. AJA248-18]